MSSSRSLQSWPRRCTTQPYGGQKKARAGEVESELNHHTAKSPKTLPPQPELFSLDEEEPGGRRPTRLAEPPGPQERIQRRTVEQPAEIAPKVQILDAPVPQTVDQLVEVLRLFHTMVPEQVMDVPMITSQGGHPAARCAPRAVVDEPVPSFDDFELVQVGEEEEEDEHPQVVPGSRVGDARGRSWCRVVGPAGVYWCVHLVMRDFETTVMDAMDVETSFGELCKKWRLAIQKEVQCLREHDVCQEMTEEERWTVLSKSIIPGESVFTIGSESTKKDQIVGGGNSQDDAGMAVSIVNVTVMTVRVLMLIASVAGLFVIGVYEQTVPLHASLYGQEDDRVRPPLFAVSVGFQ